LVVQSFQRHWRVRQMGWVSLGLLALVVGGGGIVTASPAGWTWRDRRVRRGLPPYRQYAQQELPFQRYNPQRYDPFSYDKRLARPGIEPIEPQDGPAPINPGEHGTP